jgi:hypothetical protein
MRPVLDDLLAPRRPKVSIRKVKSPLSRWNKTGPHRPAKSTRITTMSVTLQPGQAQEPTTHRPESLTAAPGP